jgi:hypothetical protein
MKEGRNKMEKIVLIGIVFLMTGITALFSGTVVWLMWPIAIPAAFPGLVVSGMISAKLSWWASVCLSWLFSLLIKSSTSTTKKDE